MSFEGDIWDALTGHAGLAALIDERLYRSRAEENPATPYVRMYQVGNRTSQALPGGIVTERPVLVFQVFAVTDEETVSVRNALRAALLASGYPVFFESDISDSEAISGLRRRDMTVRVMH